MSLSPAALHRTRYDRPQLLRKATEEVSLAGMWRKAILTFPLFDLAGDYVNPSGLNFAEHKQSPWIDLEHSRTSDVRAHPVAWARESLSKSGAPYAVEYRSLNIADEGQPPQFHSLPVGTSYFDPSDRISTQVFALVEQDALPAVSLEFRPVSGFYKSLGRSPLEPRDAYWFVRADVVRWTVCARGVNPGALSVLTKSAASVVQVPQPHDKILRDNRVSVGGTWEALDPYIRKALQGNAAEPAKQTTVFRAVEHKSIMEPEVIDAPATDANLDTANEAVADEAPALGGVSAKYAFAQTIEDACDKYLSDMQSSDSPELRKLAEKFSAMAKALAEKVKSAADKHDAKLSGDPDADLDAGTGEASEGGDDSSESADMEKDDEGTYKAVRLAYKPLLKAVHQQNVKRFKLSDLEGQQKAQLAPAEPQPDPVAVARWEKAVAEYEKWKQWAGEAA